MRGRPVDRLLAKIDQEGDGCWEWMTAAGSDRYGSFWMDGQVLDAHRAAYLLLVGPIPEGHHVLHKCDNPPCCRPSHLFTGTPSDNMKDAQAKGRLVTPTPPQRSWTACPRGHAFTEQNTYRRPSGTRECRTCRRDTQKKRRSDARASC